MKIKPYVEKLNNSKEYKEFQSKYNDAFLIAGFFILDFETGNNIHQIDYYIPSEKKIAAFTLDGGVTMQILNTMSKAVPEKLDIKTNVDLDALPGILEDEMKNRNITEEIKKIIAVIQTINGKKIWNLNCVLSGMGILKAHIDDESKTILKMEKSSLLDYIKKIPLEMLKQKQPPAEKISDLKEKIKRLSELEAEIEKEKQEAEQEIKKKEQKQKQAKSKSIKKKIH
ncbi:MAG: hypothetical protein N3D20_01095 [Candidatus Pacearchaeota archaeon]|nr:hypothetical protein [Candidatus Pacearchaeota archaeon]